MAQDPIAHGFLTEPEITPEIQASYDSDVTDHGYVMNLTRVWAHSPTAHDKLFGLVADAVELGGLTFRQRGVLIAAMASTVGDSYCSLAWGNRLATAAGEDVAGAVLRHEDEPLDPADRALAVWARTVARDANDTTAADLDPLREAGFDDQQIFAITLFVALRRAFSMVNDALGPQPDRQLRDAASAPVNDGVTFGRPAADTLS
ncbi:carboxymuconolactone decarboxylase family protein [Monashia sp. NPDC004114]